MSNDATAAAGAPPEPTPGPNARAAAEAVLDQAEIDAVTRFLPASPRPLDTGVRAMLEGGAVPREPLPVLLAAFEHLATRLSLSLRDRLGTEVDAALRALRPVRYGAFVDEVVFPSQVVVFRAEGLDGSGLVALGPVGARLVLDAVLGSGRDFTDARAVVRPFTAIETAILTRFVDAVLQEAGRAFAGVGLTVSFPIERVEADPRLAAVARPSEAAYVAEIGLEIDGRSAALQMLLPAAALESVRGRMRDSFVGREAGGDELWSSHLATAIWGAETTAEAVLHETRLPLGRVLELAVGDTLMFDMKPSDLVEVRCGGLSLARGRIGRVEGRIAVQVVEPLRRLGPVVESVDAVSPAS